MGSVPKNRNKIITCRIYIQKEVVHIKTYYIKKMDKPISIIKKISKMEVKDNVCEIYFKKEKDIEKIVKKLLKREIENIILSKELFKNKELINNLNSNNINIFDGRWLIKYLLFEILEFILNKKNIKPEETEIAITSNEITDDLIKIIYYLSKKYKRVTVVTNYMEKLKKIESEIYEKEGILIVISNNQKKSLLKPKIVLNMDFNKELLNKYKINDYSTIINFEGNMKIENKRFKGLCINDYEIEISENEKNTDIENFKLKDIFESEIYTKDTFENIRKKIEEKKVKIKDLYGINGKIERFY